MKFRRLLSILLVLSLLGGLLPAALPASAEEVQNTSAPEEVPESTADNSGETASEAETAVLYREPMEFVVNPLYAGLIDPSDYARSEQEHTNSSVTTNATYLTVAAAAKQLRNYMKSRTESFTLYVKSEEYSYDIVFENVLEKAVAHTGTATEGDYLMWQFAGYSGSVSRDYADVGYGYTFEVDMAYYTTAAQETQMDAAVTKVINSLGVKNKSDYAKVKAVYDYVCANVTYDYDNLNDTSYTLKFSAYAALVNGTAVCQGYALLMYRLLLELGVDTRLIAGYGGDEAHGWNIVQIGDLYYNLDSTWDAGNSAYEWFLLNTWNFVYHSRYADYETMDFHNTYPMAAENYSTGGTATMDPYIYAGYCGDNAIFLIGRDGSLIIGGEGATYDYRYSGTNEEAIWYFWKEDLTNIVVEEGITQLGDYNFDGLSSVTTVSLPESLEAIGYNCFQRCNSLISLDLPEALSVIEYGAFSSCTSLLEITWPSSIAKIPAYAFAYCYSLSDFTIPDTVTEIGSCAFSGCTSLEEITIPESVTNMSFEAFVDCTGLKSVYINCESVSDSAFEDCTGLTNIVLSDKLVELGNSVFRGCTALKEVVIPANIKYLGMNCFTECTSLKRVIFCGNAPSIEWSTFPAVTAYYPEGNDTWTEDILTRSYSHPITWVSYDSASMFLDHPDDAAGLPGGKVRFSVLVAASGPSYQWQYRMSETGSWKNTSATGNKTATLCVTAAESKDGYQYRCKVTDGSGNVEYSEPATLYITSILTHPANTSGALDSKVKFTVEATGKGLTYQWQYNSGSGWKNSTLTGYKTATLTVPATESRDGLKYRCQITDASGNVVISNAATLTVIPIRIASQPSAQKVKTGTNATFSVTAEGDGLTYQWQYRTSSEDTSWSSCTATGNKTASMSVAASTGKSGYQYRCKIKDSAGNVAYTNVVSLYVLGVTSQPTSQKVLTGTTATFTVTATGHNKTYQWQYRTSADGAWQNTGATGNKTATLKVNATTAKSGYQYRCQITDSVGNVVYSNMASLYVLGVTSQPTSQKVKAGNTATFTVTATGHNKTYQWQYRTASDGSWQNCTGTGNKSATMNVTATTGKSSYQYRCQITDSVGNVVCSNVASLYVLGVTSQPTSQKVLTGTTAAFTVTATGHNKTYQWQYRTSADAAWTNCTTKGNKTATLSVSATTGKSSYQYRCQITDSVGNVVYTNTVYLYVLGVTSQPSDVTVEAGASAVFAVTATGHNKTYQWEYSTDGGTTWANATATGNKTATLTVPATASRNGYQYRCKITDSVGNVVYTNAVTLTVK